MLKLSESVGETGIEARPGSAIQDSEPLLTIDRVSKRYEIYERPQDRLKQFLVPRLQTLLPDGMRRSQPFFKEFWALRDISLTVDRGEALGILGRNGAGKSTLLQIIAGTLAPTSGDMIARGKIAALLELGSGFSPDFTGKENVRLNAALLGLTSDEVDRKYQQIVEFADIGDFIDQPVKTYSTGMMMRLAFAVQTVVEPDLLIVDEALSVGDARFQKKCFDRLESLRELGTTILFVTHDTGAVVRLCTRAIILENGRICGDDAPSVVARQYHRLLFEGPGLAIEQDASSRVGRSTVESVPAPSSAENATVTVAEEQRVERAATASPDGGGTREVRYGTRDAEIFEIGIRDADGAPAHFVEVHQTSELFFRVRFNTSVTAPIGYGFIVSSVRGIEVFATKAGLYNKAIPPSHEGSVYECRFRAMMRIVPGTYFLSVAIAYDGGNRTGEFLDCRFDALQFEVIGITRSFTTCLVDLNGDLGHFMLNHKRERGQQTWA